RAALRPGRPPPDEGLRPWRWPGSCGGCRLGGGPEPERAGHGAQRRRRVCFWSYVPSWKNSTKEEKGGDRRPRPEAVCGGVGRDKITVANGNHTIPGRGHRVGVTREGAENAPRLRV